MKHLHMTLALISITFFCLRFIWLMKGSESLNKKWVKISPHIIDTLLFAVGIVMAIKLAITPMEQLWFAEKLIAIFAYIFTGIYTLKYARNRLMQILGFVGALGWVMLIVRLATTKVPMFLG